MTEQGKRETAIEEMAQFMCETGEKSCAKCKGEPNVQCGAWNEATRLYDAGYRKAAKDGTFHIDISKELTKDFFKNEIEKVLKETAKKIFEELRCHCMTTTEEDCYGEEIIPKSYTLWEDDLRKLEKTFGVEVEE